MKLKLNLVYQLMDMFGVNIVHIHYWINRCGGNGCKLVEHYLYFCNKIAKKQNDFGTNAKKILGLGDKDVPIFKKGTCLSVSLVFKLQRPKSHYVSNNPKKNQLKKNAPKQYHVARKDLDNMVKFVLDSLNGILYKDDAQICIINGTKIYANEDYNVGSTHVKLRAVDNDCVDLLLED